MNSRLLARHRGFTAIELVVVVALVAILAAVAIPNGARALELYRLNTSASILASKLTDARMNAIKRNRQAWVAIDTVNRTVRLQSTNNAGATINLGPAQPLPTGVSFASPTAPAQIRFDSLGRLPAGTPAWTLTLQGVQNTKRVNVSISVVGKVNVGNMTSYAVQVQ